VYVGVGNLSASLSLQPNWPVLEWPMLRFRNNQIRPLPVERILPKKFIHLLKPIKKVWLSYSRFGSRRHIVGTNGLIMNAPSRFAALLAADFRAPNGVCSSFSLNIRSAVGTKLTGAVLLCTGLLKIFRNSGHYHSAL